MAAQGPPPQMVGPPTSGSPMTSIGTPVSVAMQPPQPRMPGAQGSVRLTASARQEYEAYVQSRLRMRGPQGMPGGPRMPGPPPGVIPAAQPRMAIVVRLNSNHYHAGYFYVTHYLHIFILVRLHLPVRHIRSNLTADPGVAS